MSLEQQITLEQDFDKHQLLDSLQEYYTKYFGRFKSEKYPELSMRILAYIDIYKRVLPETLCGLFYKMVKSTDDTAKQARIVSKVAYNLYVKKALTWSRGYYVINCSMDPEERNRINLLCYPKPMVVRPLRCRTNNEDGSVLNLKGGILLNTHHNKDINLLAINLANKPALRIEDRLTTKLGRSDTIMSYGNTKLVEEYKDKDFWLNHYYDYRGRIYDNGYYIKEQGEDLHKAQIQLAHKELVEMD